MLVLVPFVIGGIYQGSTTLPGGTLNCSNDGDAFVACYEIGMVRLTG